MYKVHIGIEIHCALRTKAKMFSSALVTQNQDPNTSLDIIDLALPGYLPTINKKVVEYGILVCDALHCTIDPVLRFDRKNYAYPDLPKGFQITQQFYPLGKNGYMMIEGQKIGIERVHLEEDTAKMIHHSQSTLLDFNRCGTPLLEIVSTAQIHSVDQACAYVKTLQQKLIYLGVTQGRMDKGQFRCDVNVSLSQNPSQLGDKVELKNLNSISHIRQALDYEIQRQSLLLDQHKKIEMQTRRFDEKTKRTIFLRKKETQKDYRYFPEPNLPVIHLDKSWIQEIIARRPRDPKEILDILKKQGIDEKEAQSLLTQKDLTDFYFAVIKYTERNKDVLHLLLSDVRNQMKSHAISLSDVDPRRFAWIVDQKEKNFSTNRIRQWILAFLNGKNVEDQIQKAKDEQPNVSRIEEWIRQVCDANQQSIDDYRQGKKRALSYLVGQVLKVSRGQADPALVQKKLQERLNQEKEEAE